MTRTFNFSSAVNLQLMRLAADQSNYQRNYVTLALFLVGIKKSFINDMYTQTVSGGCFYSVQ